VLFAREGAKVAVVDVREDAAKATAEQIERAGGHALAIRADVAKAADIQAAVNQTLARWGRLDVFYANAGVPQRPTSVEEVDEEGMTRYRSTVPLGRLNRPEDLARAALFLASDDAAMITGSTVEVDGGRCI